MNRDKQIEFECSEIARTIAENFKPNEKYDVSDFEWSAYQVQMKGYRKASEVAEEIFELIDCAFSPVLVYNGYTVKEYLAELKEMYESEEEG